MGRKTIQNNWMKSLRTRIARENEEWLKAHIKKYIPQNVIAQYRNLEERQHGEASVRTMAEHKWKSSPVSIIEAIEKYPRIIIMGGPGLGKTTNLRYLAASYSKDKYKPLPVYIELKFFHSNYNGLAGLIKLVVKDEKRIQNVPVLFLLDGFNELDAATQREIQQELYHLQRYYELSRWIISTRKVAYPYGLEEWPVCELLGLDEEQIKFYLNYLLNEEIGQKVWKEINNNRLIDIVKSPLLLNFICEVTKTSLDRPLPKTRGELLDEIFKIKYLQKYSIQKSPAYISKLLEEITPEECLSIAGTFAYKIYEETGTITFNVDTLQRILGNNSRWKYWQFLKIFEHLNLLEKYEMEEDSGRICTLFSFWHQSIFDYLVGHHLKCIFLSLDVNDLTETASYYFEYYKWDDAMKIALSILPDKIAEKLFWSTAGEDTLLALDLLPSVEYRLSKESKEKFILQVKSAFQHISGQIAVLKTIGENRCLCFEEYLVQMLNDEYSFVRRTAASSLGKVGSHNSVLPLVKMLYDKDNRVRLSAMYALLRIGHPDAIGHLISLADDEEQGELIRAAAVSVLGSFDNKMVIDFLEKLLKNENEEEGVRECAVQALKSIGGQDSYDILMQQFIRECEEEPDSLIIDDLAEILAEAQEPEAIRILTKWLSEEDEDLRDTAARSLSKVDGLEVTKKLIKQLKNNNVDLRKRAARELGLIGDREAIIPLIAAINGDNSDVRYEAALALCNIDDPIAFKALSKLFDNENTDVRVRNAISSILCKKKDPRGIQYIDSWLREEDDEGMRILLTQELAHIEDPKSLPYLIYCLKDTSSSVKEYAAAALGEIGDPESAKALIELYQNDKDNYIQYVAAKSLAKIAPPDCLNYFTTWLKKADTDPDVKCLAAKAISRTGNADAYAIQALIECLKDSNKKVCQASAEALGEIADILNQTEALNAADALLELMNCINAREIFETVCKTLGKILASEDKNKQEDDLKEKTKWMKDKMTLSEMAFIICEIRRKVSDRRLLWFGVEPYQAVTNEYIIQALKRHNELVLNNIKNYIGQPIKYEKKTMENEEKENDIYKLILYYSNNEKRFKSFENGRLLNKGPMYNKIPNQQFLLLEESINKGGRIHWTAGFVLFKNWQSNIPTKGPLQQFRSIICNLNKIIGFDLLEPDNISDRINHHYWKFCNNVKIEDKIRDLEEKIKATFNLKDTKQVLKNLHTLVPPYPNSIMIRKQLVDFFYENKIPPEGKLKEWMQETLTFFRIHEVSLEKALNIIKTLENNKKLEKYWNEAESSIRYIGNDFIEAGTYKIRSEKVLENVLEDNEKRCMFLINKIYYIKKLNLKDKSKENIVNELIQEEEFISSVRIALNSFIKRIKIDFEDCKEIENEAFFFLIDIIKKRPFKMKKTSELKNYLIRSLFFKYHDWFLKNICNIKEKDLKDFWRFIKIKDDIMKRQGSYSMEDLIKKLGKGWDLKKIKNFCDYERGAERFILLEKAEKFKDINL